MNNDMEKKTLDILGRKYMCITQAQAGTLEGLRQGCFMGSIDANTCERECYAHIFKHLSLKEKEGISGIYKGFHGLDGGVFWIANHLRETLTYDGCRSMRVAMVMKQIGNPEYPFLISGEEYTNFIKYYSKYFGPYFYRDSTSEILKENFDFANRIIEEYHKQEINKRHARKPKLGDFVRTLSGEPGRYIGQNQAIFIKKLVWNIMNGENKLSRDIVDMGDAWIKSDDEHLPSDTEILIFIRDNNWNTKE